LPKLRGNSAAREGLEGTEAAMPSFSSGVGGAQRAHEFDPAVLESYLRRRLDCPSGDPITIERISGGQSNPTFFVTLDDHRMVMRKKPPGEILPSAHAVDREYRVLSALGATDIPVPQTILFCDDVSVVGTPFYLMKRLDGRVFSDATLPNVSPKEREAMYFAMAETLAKLHDVDHRAIGLSDYGRPGNFFQRQIGRWTKQYDLAHWRDLPDIERLVEWLPNNLPTGEETHICHGDFRIGNVFFEPTQPRIIAVLDWELSTLGEPMADLAYSSLCWVTYPEEYGGIRGLDHATLGIPSRSRYIERYFASRRTPTSQQMLPFHTVFSLFRLAVIFEGIAARARSGSAAAANAAEVGELSTVFARRAVELIDSADLG
jgi:aminoglycoside phosphotransferase (APT) family kinase protein